MRLNILYPWRSLYRCEMIIGKNTPKRASKYLIFAIILADKRACGGSGYRLESQDQAKSVLTGGLFSERPPIVETLVDPNEPPYPAHTSKKYVENFAKALIKGQPEGGRLALTMFREKIREP